MSSIVFLLNSATDAHQLLRVDLLKQEGADVGVLAFERQYYAGREPSVEVVSLGTVNHGRYGARLLRIWRALPAIRRATSFADAIYVFGLDVLFLAWLSTLGKRRPALVFEIADIQDVLLGDGLISRILRLTETFLLSRIDLLVVTSEAFVTEYLNQVRGITVPHYLEIENKVRPELDPPTSIERFDGANRDAIWVGYFGLIRDHRSLDILLTAAKQSEGRVRVYIRGILMGLDGQEGRYERLIEDSPYVEYGGAYANPDDLAEMYDQIDILWACYPYSSRSVGNWQWARTNRFYESCYFGRPLIVSKGTKDAQRTEDNQIGLSVPLGDPERVTRMMLQISDADLENWRTNLAKMPENLYLHTDEHEQLYALIGKISASKSDSEFGLPNSDPPS